jgi:hypothetical protein
MRALGWGYLGLRFFEGDDNDNEKQSAREPTAVA